LYPRIPFQSESLSVRVKVRVWWTKPKQVEADLRILEEAALREERIAAAHQIGAEHHRRGRSEQVDAVLEHEAAGVPAGHEGALGRQAARLDLRAEQPVGADDGDGRVRLGERDHVGEAGREDRIVGLHHLAVARVGGDLAEREVVVRHLLEKARRADDPDPAIARGVAGRDLASAVVAVVVAEDVFEVAVALGEDALDALRQIRGRVVKGGDDADPGCCHRGAPKTASYCASTRAR
jgi:hypothetical protein